MKHKTRSTPFRVVHLIESLGSGGAERLLVTNLKNLDRSRVNSLVVTVFSRNTYWRETIQNLGVKVLSLDCRSNRDIPCGVIKLVELLSSENADLLHTHLWAANITGRFAGWKAGVPVISSIHGTEFDPASQYIGAPENRVKRSMVHSLDAWTARFLCKRLIAVSKYVRQSAHCYMNIPLTRIEKIYNPIDTDALAISPRNSRDELLRELNLPGETRILLNVGRVSAQKGLVNIIDVLPEIIEKHPQVHLVSIGATDDKNYVAFVRGEIDRLGVANRVHLLGQRDDVFDFLRACDIFVFPSMNEGLGIAVVEAMACGCACIVSDVGGLPELIKHEYNGLVVPLSDKAKLIESVSILLQNQELCSVFGERAAEFAHANFQPQHAAEKLTEIYQKVVRASEN